MVEIVAQPLMPGYLLLVDADGLRHVVRVSVVRVSVVRVSAIQMLSDGDQCCDTTIAIVAGRALTIPLPLDDLLGQLEHAQRQPPQRPS